jgi:predicted nucleic acid-binding protein
MSGNKYLLDTNFILGLLNSAPQVLSEVAARKLLISECAYSAITRMEILGFTGIERNEETLIRQRLERMTYLPITRAIEDIAIDLRQTRKIKLPDAVIAATAICASVHLLTMDQHLQSVFAAATTA